MALTDTQIKAAKASHFPGVKLPQLTDGRGLYLKLFFDADGKARECGHSWRLDYTRPIKKTRSTLVLGNYLPNGRGMTLAEARDAADKARKLIGDGIDPADKRNGAKADVEAEQRALAVAERRKADKLAPAGTVLGVAQDYHLDKLKTRAWSELHQKQWIGMVKRCLPEHIALAPIDTIDAPTLLTEVLRPLEMAGKYATAQTVRKFLAEVWSHAEFHKLCKGNPADACLPKLVKTVKPGHNPAVVTAVELAPVLRLINGWANPITRAALQVQAALFQRPGTTCAMRWADLDLDAAVWTIQAPERSKLSASLGGNAHRVPLPRQVVAVLKSLKPLTGHSEWVFLSTQDTGKAITNDTLTNAMRSMGLGKKQNAHGFRATARTMIRKVLRFDADVIEAQLAHASKEEMGAAYDRESITDNMFAERVPMVQAWADYLDQLLADKVIEMRPLALAA